MTMSTAPADTIPQVARRERMTWVLGGGLALVGSILAVTAHPWFAGLAIVGGLWLIITPEPQSR
jgi:hypothetical protein